MLEPFLFRQLRQGEMVRGLLALYDLLVQMLNALLQRGLALLIPDHLRVR